MLLADDTKMYQEMDADRNRHTSNQQALQNRVDRIALWAQNWQMEINPSKSKVMHVGRNNPCLPYSINGALIDSVNTEGYRILDSR